MKAISKLVAMMAVGLLVSCGGKPATAPASQLAASSSSTQIDIELPDAVAQALFTELNSQGAAVPCASFGAVTTAGTTCSVDAIYCQVSAAGPGWILRNDGTLKEFDTGAIKVCQVLALKNVVSEANADGESYRVIHKVVAASLSHLSGGQVTSTNYSGFGKANVAAAPSDAVTLDGIITEAPQIITGNGDASFKAKSNTSGSIYTVLMVGSPSNHSTTINNCEPGWLANGTLFSLVGVRSGSKITATSITCPAAATSDAVTLDGIITEAPQIITGNGDASFKAKSNTSGSIYTVLMVGSPGNHSTTINNCEPGWLANGTQFSLVGVRSGSKITATSITCVAVLGG